MLKTSPHQSLNNTHVVEAVYFVLLQKRVSYGGYVFEENLPF